MNKQELIDVLKTQPILGRTKKGWDIGTEILKGYSDSIILVNQEDSAFKECLNCELVLSAELFFSGCPNCGSKDHEDVEIGEQEVKKPMK
jgi:hypothetical protein